MLAMVLLGVVVGKGSTTIDDWFTRTGHHNRFLGRLLFFTDPRVLGVLLLAALLAAIYRRRWRVAAVVAVTPVVAVVAARLFKRVFGRENGGALAYPSGHTTLAVAVLGMVVLAAGVAAWAVAIALAWSRSGGARPGIHLPLLHRHRRCGAADHRTGLPGRLGRRT